MLGKIFWLGHSTILIDTAFVIYIDPWKVKKTKRAGLIHYGDIVGSAAAENKFK